LRKDIEGVAIEFRADRAHVGRFSQMLDRNEISAEKAWPDYEDDERERERPPVCAPPKESDFETVGSAVFMRAARIAQFMGMKPN
jgi:hypothetical protein